MADPKKQQLLTRYLVLESDDEGRTWRYLGAQLAQSSEAALRAYFADPPQDQHGLYVACSENAFKPRKVAAKVKTAISEAAMPEVPETTQTGRSVVAGEDDEESDDVNEPQSLKV